jgi:hypothetical protein
MLTGVHAILLAAVTALPFTPPAGWVQLPQSAIGVRVNNVWKGPKQQGAVQPTFDVVAFAFPMSFEALLSGTKSAAGTNQVKMLSNTPLKLCGVPARMIVERLHAGGVTSILQEELTLKDGYAYILMYMRPSENAADARVTHAMRAFCPSGTAAAQALTMPAGWTKSNAEMQMAGMWLGRQPGQMIMLMRGSQMGSVDQVFKASEQESIMRKSGKNVVSVTLHKQVNLCGFAGMLADVKITGGPVPMSGHVAVTQGSGVSYVLMYVNAGTSPVDPAAIAAVNSLCATGATMPTASPAPSPSPSALR